MPDEDKEPIVDQEEGEANKEEEEKEKDGSQFMLTLMFNFMWTACKLYQTTTVLTSIETT